MTIWKWKSASGLMSAAEAPPVMPTRRRRGDDAARDSTSEFIDERTYAEADSFIAMADLELAILDGVRDRHEDDEEDERLRQSEEACTDEAIVTFVPEPA